VISLGTVLREIVVTVSLSAPPVTADITHITDRTSLKEAWSGYVNQLNFGGHKSYLWNSWS